MGAPRLGTHLLKTFLDPVRLSNPLVLRLPRTFIYCTIPGADPIEPSAARARADPAWRYLELERPVTTP